MAQERMNRDSARWCETCATYGDHHTDRHPTGDENPPSAYDNYLDEVYGMSDQRAGGSPAPSRRQIIEDTVAAMYPDDEYPTGLGAAIEEALARHGYAVVDLRSVLR